MKRNAQESAKKHTEPIRHTASTVGQNPAWILRLMKKNRESHQPNASFSSSVESAEQRARSKELPPKDRQATQSGDLTVASRNRFSAGECAAELFEEGQDLERELVESLGTTREEDEGILSIRPFPGERIPDYKNHNRL
jgi:hypothetical protein